jgi:nucleoside-diphosphate-sugar epimerase
MNVLVTGACGMIGSALVQGLLDAGHSVVGIDRVGGESDAPRCHLRQVDLADKPRLREIADSLHVDRFIHLAALAHTKGESDLSWQRYVHVNVECAQNLFDVAGERPVLFISTVDVYGFFDGKVPVNGNTPPHPVTNYGKSKVLAEEKCRQLPHFDIFRLSPVYTETVKRDIQKRYYLKYPWLAYRIGKGSQYEVLDIRVAVSEMVSWCAVPPSNAIRILKDASLLDTATVLRAEKNAGRARIVLSIPRWAVVWGYAVLRKCCPDKKLLYLLGKAVHPLRSE